MADYELMAEPFLGGYSADFNGTSLKEVSDLALISVACPLGGERELAKAVESAWGLVVPKPGQSEATDDGTVTLLGLARDQILVVLPVRKETPLEIVSRNLGAAGYYTNQTDNWVALRIDGPLAVSALERVCQIDLAPAEFPSGAVARTVMEHLGTIIVCEQQSRYLLFSGSSSARSFLHAIETSIRNIS